MATVEDKILNGKASGYCSSSSDEEGEEAQPSDVPKQPSASGCSLNVCAFSDEAWLDRVECADRPQGRHGGLAALQAAAERAARRAGARAGAAGQDAVAHLPHDRAFFSLWSRVETDRFVRQREDEQAREQEEADALWREVAADDDFLKEYMRRRMRDMQLSLDARSGWARQPASFGT